MAKTAFPTFGICNLIANKSSNDILNADTFKGYLASNPHLQVVHKHSFYHMVFFTEGHGEHIIDFVKFPVKQGMIYFMKPGQVHNWHFEGAVDGFIINFSETFFNQLFINNKLIEQFAFFGSNVQDQVLLLSADTQKNVTSIFEKIVAEQVTRQPSSQLMIAALLIQLFLHVSRDSPYFYRQESATYNKLILRQFEQLIADNYKKIKLPKDYAQLLYITPNHLNALCQDIHGTSAGEIIRSRIILEAKRLLVNYELSVSDIAIELNFKDNSYFTRFFKRYTGSTPETFRHENY